MRLRADCGQASNDFVALVALVGVLLLAAAGIASAASPGLLNGVTTAWQRALCAVAGERCEVLDREPCPVLRTVESETRRVSVALVELGHDRKLSIERRSDGSYVVTLLEGRQAGATVGVGADIKGIVELSADASSLLGRHAGRSYAADDRAAATALVERLRGADLPSTEALLAADDFGKLRALDPAAREYVFGGNGVVDSGIGARLLKVAEAAADAAYTREAGLRIDPRREEITRYVQIDSRASVFVDALDGVGTERKRRGNSRREEGAAEGTGLLSAGADAVRSATLALRHDRAGTLIGATLTASGGSGERLDEMQVRFDLGDAEQLAAVRALTTGEGIGALRRAGEVARLRGAAVDERSYAVRNHQDELGAELALGLKLGAEQRSGVHTAELTEQYSRPVGGVWAQRLDCVA